MFDIGFAELLLVAIIGLLVLGPEKLPEAIRTGALWLGRLRRSFNEIKNDISREIGADEIRQQLHNESILESLEKDKERLLDLDRKLRETVDAETSLTTNTVDAAKKTQPVSAPVDNAVSHESSTNDGTDATNLQQGKNNNP